MKIFITIFALIVSFNAYPRWMNKCEKDGKVSYQSSYCSDNDQVRAKLKPSTASIEDSFEKFDTTYSNRLVDLSDDAALDRHHKDLNIQQRREFSRR